MDYIIFLHKGTLGCFEFLYFCQDSEENNLPKILPQILPKFKFIFKSFLH